MPKSFRYNPKTKKYYDQDRTAMGGIPDVELPGATRATWTDIPRANTPEETSRAMRFEEVNPPFEQPGRPVVTQPPTEKPKNVPNPAEGRGPVETPPAGDGGRGKIEEPPGQKKKTSWKIGRGAM